MGDRALILLASKKGAEVSPVAYLHWGGDSVPALVAQLKLFMKGRTDDVNYAYARLLGLAHAASPEHNTGIGGWNTPEKIQNAALVALDKDAPEPAKGEALQALKEYSHGDAGVIVVNASDFSWQAFGGYLERFDHERNEMPE